MIDCDVHCAPKSMDALSPYLSSYWRQYIEEARVSLHGLVDAYPPGAPTSGPAVAGDYGALKAAVLDDGPSYAVLNCLFDNSKEFMSELSDWFGEHLPAVETRMIAPRERLGRRPRDAICDRRRRRRGDPRGGLVKHL